jgi:hypothetical protein
VVLALDIPHKSNCVVYGVKTVVLLQHGLNTHS